MRTHTATILAAMSLSTFAWAGDNPVDSGTPGYTQQIYVDNQSTCMGSRCGSRSKPYKSISEAVSRVQPGDEVIIAGRDGFPYYDWFNLPKLDKSPAITPPTLIRGWKGMPKPTIRGSLPYIEWLPGKQPNSYYLHWDYVPADDPGSILEPQQVYRNNISLRQVGGRVFGGYPDKKAASLQAEEIWPGRIPDKSPHDLAPNQFYYDRFSKIVHVRLDSPLRTNSEGRVVESMEVSIRHFLAVNNTNYRVNNITFKGLLFERSNTSYYWRGGAILLNGDNITLDNLTVQDMDSFCVQLSGNNNTLRDSTIQRCGQLGLAAGGNNLTVFGNQFLHNNTRLFNQFWEAGAMKFVAATPLSNSRIINNLVAFTKQATGIWLDTFQDNNLIANNQLAYNEGIGIHIEVSNAANIQGNTIIGSGAQGIQLVDSNGTTITGNVIAANTQDAVLIQSDSRAVSNPKYRSINNKVSGNIFAWNWENSAIKNHRSIAVPRDSATTINSNKYCGTGTGSPKSLRYVLENNALDWPSWKGAGKDNDSTQMVAPLPPELQERMRKGDLTLVKTPALLDYIKTSCK